MGPRLAAPHRDFEQSDGVPGYVVTIRFGVAPSRYEVLHVEAASVREALRLAADRFPEEADTSADLVEIRRRVEPEDRG